MRRDYGGGQLCGNAVNIEKETALDANSSTNIADETRNYMLSFAVNVKPGETGRSLYEFGDDERGKFAAGDCDS